LLIILTVITYVSLFYFQIVKRFWGKSIHQAVLKPIGAYYDRVWKYRLVHSSNSFDNRRNSPWILQIGPVWFLLGDRRCLDHISCYRYGRRTLSTCFFLWFTHFPPSRLDFF
jgi:hypothetical protein